MSRILVLGAGGMLGHKVCQSLHGHEVVGLVRRSGPELEAYPEIFAGVTLVGDVDVLQEERLQAAICDVAPQVVVNCVGLVKQLKEAEDPYLAVAINALLPHRLARLCAEMEARLIHISTDCVFDGRRGSYRESDLTDARDLYGRSKALGETTPVETSAVTLRTSFIGREIKSYKHGLVEWLLAQDGGSVQGYDKVVYSGLTSFELAGVVRRVVNRHPDLRGLYHVASEPVSKYYLLVLLRRIYGLDVEIRRVVEPVCDRSLVMEAFTEATGYHAPAWPEMIRQMYDEPTPYGAWRSQKELNP